MLRPELRPSVSSVLALLFASSLARAEKPDKPAAETLFDRGRELLSAQRTSEACAKFEASQELDAGVGTLLYLGDCYERLGRTASAWASFKEAISLAQTRADAREQLASVRAAALEPRLTRVVLRVREMDRIPGLTIRIGRAAIPRASWGVALPVDPGRQRVEASAPGHENWARSFELAGPGNSVIEVPRLQPQAAGAFASPDPPSPGRGVEPDRAAEPGSGQRTIGLLLGGLGVAGLAGGTVLAVQAKRKDDASLKYCPNDQHLCTPHGKELRDQALDYAHASTAVFAAAGALLVAGIVVHVTSPAAPSSGPRPLSVGAAIGSKRAELSMSGVF